MSRSALSTPTATRGWSPWRAVVGFGVVSLAADMVYEGARSVTGPLLASLGASAVLVGLVTGAGEAMALVLRLVFGSMADRTGRYWALTLGGYAMTAVCVPALAVAPLVGGAGLALACVLILAERTGKAVRSPSKSDLLAHAAAAVGFGRGFAVHKALDEVGAFAGPLLVAGGHGAHRRALAGHGACSSCPAASRWCCCCGSGPGWATRSCQPLPVAGGEDAPESPPDVRCRRRRHRRRRQPWCRQGERLPRRFWLFAASSGAATAGLVTFGVISYHLTRDHVVPLAGVPVVYAAAMAAAAVAALVTGWLYDRWNASRAAGPAGAGGRRPAAGVLRHARPSGRRRAAVGSRRRRAGLHRQGARRRAGAAAATRDGVRHVRRRARGRRRSSAGRWPARSTPGRCRPWWPRSP